MAYFPNGTAGEILENQCAECPLGQAPCPVLLLSLEHNYDQCDNPVLKKAMNLQINEEGICQLKPLLIEGNMPMPDPEPDMSHPHAAKNKPMLAMQEWLDKQKKS